MQIVLRHDRRSQCRRRRIAHHLAFDVGGQFDTAVLADDKDALEVLGVACHRDDAVAAFHGLQRLPRIGQQEGRLTGAELLLVDLIVARSFQLDFGPF